jgi:histidyl-tRNA synthetase
LEEQGLLNPELSTAPADVLILPMTDDLSPAVAFATACRGSGVKAQLYTEPKKFKAKMNYADKLSVPFVAFLGEDEAAKGMVSLKDMVSGDQEQVALSDAPGWLKERVAARNQGAPVKE